MALTISPVHAAAILLPVLCLMDLVGVRVYCGKWDKENLKIMLPGALLGVAMGTLTFGVLSENTIRILIGCRGVAFPLNAWFGYSARQPNAGRSAIKGTFWSGVSGLTSFLAHAGGPPAMVYLLPQRLDKTTYVATISVFFMFVNAVKLVPYAWLGQFSAANLSTSLLADSSKFSCKASLILCALNRIATVITDTGASDAAVQMLERAGVNVIVVDPELELAALH